MDTDVVVLSKKKRKHICALEREKKSKFRGDLSFGEKCRNAVLLMILVSKKNANAQKIFRSSTAIEKERKRHQEASYWYMVHPLSKFETIWSFFMIIVLILLLIFGPFIIVFTDIGFSVNERYTISNEVAYKVAFHSLLILDCLKNFFTGYIVTVTKDIVLEPLAVAKQYVRTTFFWDIISAIPIAYLLITLTSQNELNWTLVSLDLLKFLTLLRIISLVKYMNRLSRAFSLGATTVRVVFTLMLLVFYLHYAACFQYLVPMVVHWNDEFWPFNSWVELAKVKDKTAGEKYSHAMFRAVAQSLGAGFGHTEPETMEDISTAVITVIFGFITLDVVLIAILHSMSSKKSSEIKYEEMMSQLREYMRYKQLPLPLQSRLTAYYQYKFQNRYFRENVILDSLSDHLREDVLMHNCRQMVGNVVLFRNLPKHLLYALVGSLKMEVFLTNDVIIRAGSIGNNMYFLAYGTVAILSPTGREVCHLEDGAHFGEVAMVDQMNLRVASVIAVEICQLYRLDRSDFQRLMEPYPKLMEKIQRLANQHIRSTIVTQEKKNLIEEMLL